MKRSTFYFACCLLLIFCGFVIAQINFAASGQETSNFTNMDFVTITAFLANLATITGLGLALKVYSSWGKQQKILLNEKALLEFYSAFSDFVTSFYPYVAITRAKYNFCRKIYSSDGDGVWTPDKAKVVDNMEEKQDVLEETYQDSFSKYGTKYDLFCLATGLKKVEGAEPLIIHELICNFRELIEETILLGSYSDNAEVIEQKQETIRLINESFVDTFYKVRSELDTLNK